MIRPMMQSVQFVDSSFFFFNRYVDTYLLFLNDYTKYFVAPKGHILGPEGTTGDWVPPPAIAPFTSKRVGVDGEQYTFISAFSNYNHIMTAHSRVCGSAMPELVCDCRGAPNEKCSMTPRLGPGGALIKYTDYRSAPNVVGVQPNK